MTGDAPPREPLVRYVSCSKCAAAWMLGLEVPSEEAERLLADHDRRMHGREGGGTE